MNFSIKIYKRHSNLNLNDPSNESLSMKKHTEKSSIIFVNEDENDTTPLSEKDILNHETEKEIKISRFNKCPFCKEPYMHFTMKNKIKNRSRSRSDESEGKKGEHTKESLYFAKSTVNVDFESTNNSLNPSKESILPDDEEVISFTFNPNVNENFMSKLNRYKLKIFSCHE